MPTYRRRICWESDRTGGIVMKNGRKLVGFSVLVAATLAWSIPMVAHAQPMATVFNEGTMDFDFTGSLSGGFSADGSVTDVTQFPVDADGACIGYYTTSDFPGAEGATFQCYGGVVNPDDTMDIVVIWIIRQGETGLTPGPYAIDAEETVIVVFYDDADEVLIVEGTPPIVTSAAHFFTALPGGSVNFGAVSHAGASGTFSCTMEDELNTLSITVTDAPFNMTSTGTPAENASWGDIKSTYK